MDEDSKRLADVISIDQDQLKGHVGEIVRSTVEQTLNGLLDAEADRLCRASRYERSPDRQRKLPHIENQRKVELSGIM